MSLIHTCELNGANPFDCLTELQRYAEDRNTGRQRGCRGITARHWDGWHDLLPRNIMIPSWPKKKDCGQSGETIRSGCQTGI